MTTLAQDFAVLRPAVINVRGGFHATRALREEAIVDAAVLEMAERSFEDHSKRLRDSGYSDFVLDMKARGVKVKSVLSRPKPSPADLPTPIEVEVEPISYPMLTAQSNIERRRTWHMVTESARRSAEWVRRSTRVLLLKDHEEVLQTTMDTLTEYLSDHLKNQVGIWRDFRDSFRELDMRMGVYA